jgi:hypothetical protein
MGACIVYPAMTEAAVYNKLQDLRLLARRDNGQIDRQLEAFRLEFFAAFEQYMDGMEELNLTPFIVTADKIITGNKDLLRWLKREFELEADFG